MTPAQIEFYKRLAHGLALQFGPNCEVVVHDLETEDVDHSIVVIENGHVSGRKLGDGPSHIVFESMHEGTTDVHVRSTPLPAPAARAIPSPSPLPRTSATCSRTCCTSASSLWASPRHS